MTTKHRYSFADVFSPLSIFNALINVFLSDKKAAKFTVFLAFIIIPFLAFFANFIQITEFEQATPIPFLTPQEENSIRNGSDKSIVRVKVTSALPMAEFVTTFQYEISGWKYSNKGEIKGSLAVISIAIYAMAVSSFILGVERSKSQRSIITYAPSLSKQIGQVSASKEISATTLLEKEALHSKQIAVDANFKAYLLLWGGVIMAFVGIGIFYLAIPEVKSEKTLTQTIQEALRPMCMLIFIEALAWFLLKQYRAASDDYVRFLATANRCANLLSVYLTINDKTPTKERQLIIEHLLRTPQNTVLKEGETTENIELQKIGNTNPVFDTSSSLIEKLLQSKSNDK